METVNWQYGAFSPDRTASQALSLPVFMLAKKGFGGNNGREASLAFDKALMWLLADLTSDNHSYRINMLEQLALTK